MLCYQMKKKPEPNGTEQVLIRLRSETIQRLEDNVRNSIRPLTRNQIAVEIIEQYLEFWEQKEGASNEAFARQRESTNVRTSAGVGEEWIEVPILKPYRPKSEKKSRRA